MFDLLHKTQRSLHLNTLETLVAITSRYSAQFQTTAPSILKELIPFITDADLQSTALALKVASQCLLITPQANEVQDVIDKSTLLSNSQLIQGSALVQLLNFFAACSNAGVVKDQTVTSLSNFVSLSTQASAMCLAAVALRSAKKQQLLNDFIAKVKDSNTQKQVVGALCLGEFGKHQDVSGISGIIDMVANLFKGQHEDVRTAGSICLGNISVGNTDFFLKKVFALVDQSQH